MQALELDKKINNITGDVECIKFRPSPNFKHMKKYLKAISSPNQSSDCSTPPPSSEAPVEEQEKRTEEEEAPDSMAQQAQPPLPPNSPPKELVIPKVEIEDEEYDDKVVLKKELKTEKDVKSEKTMCRQFARGMCTRGAACIYVHEMILSQLPGVYTFCKNYQNSVCNFPKCKFVHATVFEKEHFYRTGYLPPHTLQHLKETNSALGPPSGSDASPPEGTLAYTNPPPAVQPGISSLPSSGAVPPVTNDTELYGPSPKLKRTWKLFEDSKENNADEPGLKKCRSCNSVTLSHLAVEDKLDNLQKMVNNLKTEASEQNKKERRLNEILDLLTKSHFNMADSPRDKGTSTRKTNNLREMSPRDKEASTRVMKLFMQGKLSKDLFRGFD